MGYAKKRERKEKCPCQKAWERENACQRAWRKEKKKGIKDSSYFQIKAFIQKERESWFKKYQKYLELESYKNSTHFHVLIKSVWLASPWGLVFYLAKYVMHVCPTFHTYLKLHSKALVVGYEKEGKKIQIPLVRFHTYWVVERIIWGTYIYFAKTYKTSG